MKSLILDLMSRGNGIIFHVVFFLFVEVSESHIFFKIHCSSLTSQYTFRISHKLSIRLKKFSYLQIMKNLKIWSFSKKFTIQKTMDSSKIYSLKIYYSIFTGKYAFSSVEQEISLNFSKLFQKSQAPTHSTCQKYLP